MGEIRERLDSLRALMQEDDFLDGKGLSNEVNIRIFCYDAADEMTVRHFIRQIKSDQSMRCQIVECDIYKVFLVICDDMDITEAIPDMEEADGGDYLLEQLHSAIGEGEFIEKIYWLFDSGRKNGFKCLIYMHRYRPDTIARIRTDYVHEQQARYRTAIADLEHRVANAATSERVKLNKQLTKLQAQADELREYEEKIHHLADQMIAIDLDDGVKKNYAIFKDVLAKIK